MRALGAVRGRRRRAATGGAPGRVDRPRARGKPAGGAFRRLHAGILASAPEATPWKGRGILAVDGSKVTLPRELADQGYSVPDGAHYPQGMVSVLYRLRDRIPVDLHLFGHENERLAARTHLDRAAEGDVIVYDRGYYSFAMALAHLERGLDFVFRVKEGATRPSTPLAPRARRSGPSPSTRRGTRPRRAAGRSASASSGTRRGTRSSDWRRRCWTAGATESSRSATYTTAAGASRRCTKAENP